MNRFIYQKQDWPKFRWDNDHLISILGSVRNLQGKLIGSMETLGFELKNEASLETLTLDIIKTTEIEDEILNPEQVRSSLARRLGLDIGGLIPSDRNVDGVVDMMLNAIQNYNLPLSEERLFDWHFSLFPTGRSGMYKITVGKYRDDKRMAVSCIDTTVNLYAPGVPHYCCWGEETIFSRRSRISRSSS